MQCGSLTAPSHQHPRLPGPQHPPHLGRAGANGVHIQPAWVQHGAGWCWAGPGTKMDLESRCQCWLWCCGLAQPCWRSCSEQLMSRCLCHSVHPWAARAAAQVRRGVPMAQKGEAPSEEPLPKKLQPENGIVCWIQVKRRVSSTSSCPSNSPSKLSAILPLTQLPSFPSVHSSTHPYLHPQPFSCPPVSIPHLLSLHSFP